MSIIDSLTQKAREAEDYNDMNLARLLLTAADEIELLQGVLSEIVAVLLPMDAREPPKCPICDLPNPDKNPYCFCRPDATKQGPDA